MRNPFTHHPPDATPQQVDEAYASQGWGVTVERRIPRPGSGEPLYFQLRLPNDTVYRDIVDLGTAGSDVKSSEEAAEGQRLLDGQTEALTRLGGAPATVLVGA